MPIDAWTTFAPRPEELPNGKKWTVFLSYRSVNRRWVLNLYDILSQHGHTVFLDHVSIVGGQDLIDALEKNLQASMSGILVWSKEAVDSSWIRKEYQAMEGMASRGGFQFVPVGLDDADLPVFAGGRLHLDFSAYPDGPNGGELMRLLHALVGRPLSPAAARFAVEQDELAHLAKSQIEAAIDVGNWNRLIQLFREGSSLPWLTTSVLGCHAAEGLTMLKRDNEAIEMLIEVERRFPSAVRPKQLRALALARRGESNDLADAQEILATLIARGHKDPETLGIYGRTWMDRYAKSGDILELRKSRDLYAEAFEYAHDDYYTGINAAAKSFLIGGDEIEVGRAFAARVEKIVGSEVKWGDYWLTATVAEVQLQLGNYELAGLRYRQAVAMAPQQRASHETSWIQACRLMRKLNPSPEDRAHVRNAFLHLADCDELLSDAP